MAAPFSLCLLILGLLCTLCPGAVYSSDCPATSTDERVKVVHVYDGDTVKLEDGRRLRIIGINTPELTEDNTPTRPLADRARATLQEILDTNNKTLLLQYDSEHQDHYGRLLAHTFTESGDNVAGKLLQRGLATTLVVPPNTWGMHCYHRIENDARIDQRGLWDLPDYQSQPAQGLPLSTRGYRIVQGNVSNIRESRNTVWVDLDGPLTLQISRQDLSNFGSPESLKGAEIEARGWIRQDGNGLRMRVQHPAALVIISAEKP